VPPVTESPRAERTAPPSAGHGTTTIRYRVRNGESLWIIAGKYNTTVEKLRSLNALGRSEPIRAGQIIRVPAAVDTVADVPAAKVTPAAPAQRTHVVRRGETLSSIAAQYGVTLTALRNANQMDTQSVLKAGERLVIPD